MAFGIIIATIFVFIQIINFNYSYRLVKHIIKDGLLISYFIISIFVLGATAIGSFSQSIGTHDLFPGINFRINYYYSNQYFILALLSLFFISIILFFVLAALNFRNLRPSKILLISEKSIRYNDIRFFLFKKYGINRPKELGVIDLSSEKEYGIMNESMVEINPNDIGKDLLNKLELEKYKQEPLKYKRYSKLWKQIKSASDPLETINYIVIQSIKKTDLKTLDSAIKVLMNISDNFIKYIQKLISEELWDPDKKLLENFLKYSSESSEMFIETCEKQETCLLELKVLDISRHYTDLLLENEKSSILFQILNFWRKVADNSIGKSPEIFKRVISYYDRYGKEIFNIDERVLVRIFKNLGWLGERLLLKKGFEERPLMSDIGYHTEYDELMNCINSFGNKYKSNPEKYPYAYFESVSVIFQQLIKLFLKNKENNDIKNNLLDCLLTHYYFAEEAIKARNSEGAGLAVKRINKYYKEFEKNRLHNHAKVALTQLVEISLKAAIYSKELREVYFLNGKIDMWAKKRLIEISSTEIISEALRKGYNKTVKENQDIALKYIKELGHEMKTNFGFKFNWKTCK